MPSSPSHSRSPSASTSTSLPPPPPSSHPTFIEIPAPPSGTVTPSDMGPSTPNSTTTSLSALSTVAMKDGHRGANATGGIASAARRGLLHYGLGLPTTSATEPTSSVDALRADRISRLAGLERVGVAGGGGGGGGARQSGVTSSYLGQGQGQGQGQHSTSTSISTQPPAYSYSPSPAGVPGVLGGFTHFDPWGGSTQKERSTVGSASATGSTGGRTTTWMSASQDGDSMSISDDADIENENDNENDLGPDAAELVESQRMGVGMPQDSETANALPPGGVWDGRVDMRRGDEEGEQQRRQQRNEEEEEEDDDDDDDELTENENDDQASLVGFGEGANSTVSGPISTLAALARTAGSANSPVASTSNFNTSSNYRTASAARPNSTAASASASASTSLPMHGPRQSQSQAQAQAQGQPQTSHQHHHSSASQSNLSNVSSDTGPGVGALSPTGNTAAAPGAIPPSPLSSSSNVAAGGTGTVRE